MLREALSCKTLQYSENTPAIIFGTSGSMQQLEASGEYVATRIWSIAFQDYVLSAKNLGNVWIAMEGNFEDPSTETPGDILTARLSSSLLAA